MAKKSRVWSSQEVNINIEKMRMGQDFDNSAFYSNDPDLKSEYLNFELTPDEFQEYVKCSQDCIYFVQKYCNFLTDKGRRAVQLRDYQKKILKILTDEKYDSDISDVIPRWRNIALCQSRQSGKCCTSNTYVTTPSNQKIKFYEIYKSHKFPFSIIKIVLYKLYNIL